MDSSTVYIKTALGSEEVASRSHGLSSRERAMLIMIDGRRSAAALLLQNTERAVAESQLAALVAGGFIEAVNVTPPVVAAELPAAAAPASPAADLGTIKQYINSVLHSILGPDADLFSVKVDAANDIPSLLAISEKLYEVIRSAGGKKKADDFKEKVSSLFA